MTETNLEIWDKLKTPPATALKKIGAGRLKGMSDISPQWRFQIMTNVFGPVGSGWKYTIDKLWLETGVDAICAFAMVSLYYRENGEWSDPIPGIGGSMLVAKEKSGPYTSDEAYKMAVTDALSVAMKALGVAADVYLGMMDGSKYQPPPQQTPPKPDPNKERMYQQFHSAMTNTTTIESLDQYVTDNAEQIKRELGGTEYRNMLLKDMADHKAKLVKEQMEA